MATVGILDRLLLLDLRFLLVIVCACAVYYRPALRSVPGSAAADGAFRQPSFTFSIRRGKRIGVCRLAAAVIGLLVWLAAGLVPLALASVRWPLVHDAPLMHYIAWRIGSGAVPYRDIFDMNLPGVYLLHAAVLRVFGSTDGGWRLFDFLWLVLTGWLLWRLCVPRARGWALAAPLFYAAFHVSSGPPAMGQRDYLEFGFLAVAMLLACAGLEPQSLPGSSARCLLLSGLALGYAASIKPLALLMLAAVAVMAFLRSPGQGSTRWRSAALVACGGLTAPTLFGAWLWAIGGLQPFLHTFFSVMPLYAKMHDRPFADYAREFWPIWLPCLLSVPAAFAGGKPDTRRVLLILGVAYGALHYLLQGKGWLYQLYPLLGFGSALIAGVLGDLPKLRREAGAAVCGLAAAFTIALGAWDGRLRPALALTADRMATVSALEADLAQRLRPGVRVQTFDTTGGCVHALFRVHASLPTRFLCDYLFYSYTDRPYVREIHSDLIARMAERPPELLVVYRWGWPAGQYERIGKFQALKSVIDAEYQVDVTRPQYVIYSRRARYAQVAPESGR